MDGDEDATTMTEAVVAPLATRLECCCGGHLKMDDEDAAVRR